jgi:hypothetical protein
MKKRIGIPLGVTRGCATRKYPEGYDTNSRLFAIWNNMLARCHRPNNKMWHHYGGRGIAVCQEWQRDYSTFMRWALANGYANDLTIERKNVDEGYEPTNCCWIPLSEQNSNRRSGLPPFTAFGETKTLKEWVSDPRCVVKATTVYNRLLSGRTMEWAISHGRYAERRPSNLAPGIMSARELRAIIKIDSGS